MQLKKGRTMFEELLMPLAGLKEKNWRHVGFVVFPEIEDRQTFQTVLGLTDAEVRTVVTKEEMRGISWMNEYLQQQEVDVSAYESLISIILGSQFVHYQDQAFNPFSLIRQSADRLGKSNSYPDSPSGSKEDFESLSDQPLGKNLIRYSILNIHSIVNFSTPITEYFCRKSSKHLILE